MTPTRTPGAEPATLMGPGWQPRSGCHRDEMGTIWADFGVCSEVDPLTAVLLTWPGDGLRFEGEPAAWLMHARPDLERMREEALGLAEAYESAGAAVHWLRPAGAAPPNLVFARDLVFMTPEGAVLARMAAQQRAGEERLAAAVLAGLGIPILATPTARATFEGADALWFRPDLVVVGVGRRTNVGGYEVVRRALADQNVECVAVPLSPRVQHLLGSVNFVSAQLAVVREPSAELGEVLVRLGIVAMDLDDDPATAREVLEGRANNFVTLRPGTVLLPAGCPATRARLLAEGVQVVERPVGEYLCAAGGIGCATGILGRRG